MKKLNNEMMRSPVDFQIGHRLYQLIEWSDTTIGLLKIMIQNKDINSYNEMGHDHDLVRHCWNLILTYGPEKIQKHLIEFKHIKPDKVG